MATNSSPPGGNSPNPSGNGSQPSTNKPRATIVLKNPNAKSTSSGSLTPATPSASQKLPVARPSIGAANQSSRRAAAQIQTDREALGLSAARPSEMVAGLDEAVKRAEALAAREEAKRKSGGKLNANVALHVDDTGKKWALWVRLGIAVALVLGLAAGGFMIWSSNHTKIDPRKAVAETRDSMIELELAAKKMERFDASDNITVASAKARLTKTLEGQLASVEKSIQKDRESGRTPDKMLINKREFLKKLLTFKDGWDKPFDFSVSDNELTIRSVTQYEGIHEPVKVPIAGTKKTEKEEK